MGFIDHRWCHLADDKCDALQSKLEFICCFHYSGVVIDKFVLPIFSQCRLPMILKNLTATCN